MSPEIQPADPVYRVRFLIVMTVVALAGAAGVLYLNGYLTELHALAAESQPLAAGKALRAGRAVLAILAAGAVVISLYLGRISRRTLSSGRFPPPGTRVISDTRVRHGRAARRRGQAGLAMAALTLLLTAVVVLQANRLLEALLETELKPTLFQPAEPPRQEIGGSASRVSKRSKKRPTWRPSTSAWWTSTDSGIFRDPPAW